MERRSMGGEGKGEPRASCTTPKSRFAQRTLGKRSQTKQIRTGFYRRITRAKWQGTMNLCNEYGIT